jgi:inner membrane protein
MRASAATVDPLRCMNASSAVHCTCGPSASRNPGGALLGHAQLPPMDSLSQIALGAAVGVATMGRRTAVWKAAMWGAVAGTLPDLDVLVDHGDPIHNMVLHRAETHALFWLTIFSLPLAAGVARLHGEWALWRRWWLALWLVLVTHPLLDAMTVYGTQLALPFSNHPYGVGSVFIIDPLYTLPLLVGTGWALVSRGGARSLVANGAGLALSTVYLVWGVAAQQHVDQVARASATAQGIAAERMLVTPTAFNSLLWRVVVLAGDHYHEGFYSLLDAEPRIHFDRFERGNALAREVQGIDGVQRIVAFSKGFYKLQQEGARVLISDLRMGQEPAYNFTFAVAERHSPPAPLIPSEQVGTRPDIERGLPWLWRRMWGEPIPPPR